ncbi:hypothetical protein AeRB84_016930, partial [Aphanomyces euteiches]
NVEHPESLKTVVAVRAMRYDEGYKEFEVQFEASGSWCWEAEALLMPNKMLAEFEMPPNVQEKHDERDSTNEINVGNANNREIDTNSANTEREEVNNSTANGDGPVHLPGWSGIVTEEVVI